MERFKGTLALGFRLGLLLMVPAMAGLIALRMPIVAAIFQRHNFSANDTLLTATALQNYAYQLPFVAIDQLLISAFYARKNTIIPVSVLFVGVLGYLAVALPFWQTIGMPALALANAVPELCACHCIASDLENSDWPFKTRPDDPNHSKDRACDCCHGGYCLGITGGIG